MLLSLADVKTVKMYWAAMADSMRNKVDNSVRASDFQDDVKENNILSSGRVSSYEVSGVSVDIERRP